MEENKVAIDSLHVTRFCDNHEEPLLEDEFGIEYCAACGFVPNDEEIL